MEFKDQLEGLLERIYPERWDIRYVSERAGYRVQIHFPEVTIKNSRKLTRLLKDMYVSFSISERCMTEGLQGLRTTYFYDELRSGYTHSHLPGDCYFDNNRVIKENIFRYQWFCLGDSDLSMMHGDLRMRTDLFKLEMFLFFLEPYLAWESLEGGPYFRMENISDAASDRRYNCRTEHVDSLTRYMLENLADLPIKMDTIHYKKKFTIDHTNKKLYEILNANTDVKAYTKGDTNIWYSVIPGSSGIADVQRMIERDTSGNTFMFKGEVVPLKLISKEEVGTEAVASEYTYRLPPEALKYACDNLTRQLNQYYRNNELSK